MIPQHICPVANFNKILGGKWKLIIINTLRNKGEIRFGKLAFFIPAISRKVLSAQLKELERDGLVIRTQHAWRCICTLARLNFKSPWKVLVL